MFRSHALPGTEDKYVRIILFSGLVIQIISAINAIGYWHPDQHHSIIEFATYLGQRLTPGSNRSPHLEQMSMKHVRTLATAGSNEAVRREPSANEKY